MNYIEPKVGIVIVNYNGAKYQNDSIRSLKNMDYHNYEIIVVDNGSTDNSLELLRKEFDDVLIVETNKNLGVAAGNNIGIRYALKRNAEYVLLLNNDIELSENVLSLLVQNASNRIMTVPKIYYYDKKRVIWSAGGEVNWKWGLPYHIGQDKPDNARFNIKKVVEIAPTCCMLIHKEVFIKVGYMDEKYFMYFDDTDFCIRANDKGYKILYIPEAKMWHKVSSSSGGANSKICRYYVSRNILYFMNKYRNRVGNKKYNYIIGQIKYSIMHYRKDKNAKYILLGFLDYLRGKMYIREFR